MINFLNFKRDTMLLLLVVLITFYTRAQQTTTKNSVLMYQVAQPDYKRSPYTGMTRKHWKDAAIYLLKGAFSYVKTMDDPMKFPKQPGKSYPFDSKPNPTELLEGFCRTLFMAAPLLKEDPGLVINNIKVTDYFRYNLIKLLDPKSNTYIPPRPGDWPSQNLVEFGGLSVSLFSIPELLWDPLTPAQKASLSATMLSYGEGPTVPNNWKFFNIMILSFYKSRGYKVNEALLEELVIKALAQYDGQGWYNDNPALDYYSMWGFQMYGMLWTEFFGKKHYPDYAKQFLANFKDIKHNYPYMFSKNGEMIMWGRSISYRFGATIPLALTGMENDPSTNYGWMRRISSGTLLQFLQNPDFLKEGIPTLGFYGAFEPAVQMYSARGSVFWMSKAFLSLLMPETNPYWMAVENDGAWNEEFKKDKVYNRFSEKTKILVTDYPGIGAAEIRSIVNVRTQDKPPRDHYRNDENYNRLSYNSAFPWQADGPNGEVAMNYVFKNKIGKWEPACLYTFNKFENGVYYRNVGIESNDKISLALADLPLRNGILRVDKNTSTESVQLRLGHYALPRVKGDIKKIKRKVGDYSVEIIDNGVYQIAVIPISGWDRTEVLTVKGLNPVSKQSTVINLASEFSPSNKPLVYVTLMLWKKSGTPWSDRELTPLKRIKQESVDNKVSLWFRNGEMKVISH